GGGSTAARSPGPSWSPSSATCSGTGCPERPRVRTTTRNRQLAHPMGELVADLGWASRRARTSARSRTRRPARLVPAWWLARPDPTGAGRPLAPAAAGLEPPGGLVLDLGGGLVGQSGEAQTVPGARSE